MLTVVTAGLPLSAKELIYEAARLTFGEVDMKDVSSQNLRSRVRLSGRNVNDVLVVLDGVSHNTCQDIENGLYQSDKYYEYSDDESLVAWLNDKYGLDLEIKSETPMELVDSDNKSSPELEAELEQLRDRLNDRDWQIKSLKGKIAELENELEMGGSDVSSANSEEVAKLKSELDTANEDILKLKDEILTLTAAKKAAEDATGSLRKLVNSLSESSEKSKTDYNRLDADYRSVSTELGNLRSKYSEQSGLLRLKDEEITDLKKQIENNSGDSNRIQELENEKKLAEIDLESAKGETSRLKVELASKETEVSRLQDQLNSEGRNATEEVSRLESKIKEKDEEISDLNMKIASLEQKISSMSVEKSSYEGNFSEQLEKIARLEGEVLELKERIKVYNDESITLNKELVEARSTAEMLERSTNRDTDIEDLYREANEIRQKYEELTKSVFGKMASYSNPHSSIMVSLLDGGDMYKNIRFVFSGSTESRKGTYRSMMEEFRQLPEGQKVVIVDATSETCVDYVFEIKKVVNGLNWFVKGGGILPYLSQTCMPNVQVLSPGLGYINDTYFLTVDWESRLKELESSGYSVVVYCGDISTAVGRILHESFAGRSQSLIYVHGNAIGARTIVANLKGISNATNSIICYFDYSSKMDRFFKIVAEKHECRVISMC